MVSDVGTVTSQGVVSTQMERVRNDAALAQQPPAPPPPPSSPPAESGRGATVDTTT